MTTDPSPAGGRWFRVNTTWSQSEWLAVLAPAARLAWIEVLSHVKAHGFDGRVRAVAPAVFGRMVGIDAADVRALLDAAQADGALEVDDGHWVITGWLEHQGDPTAKYRMQRYRDRNVTPVTRNDRNVTPTETETETETEEKKKPTVSKKKAFTVEFDAAWAEYPIRAGSNSKPDAYSAWNARVKEGVTPAELLAGVKRYAAFCHHTGKLRSEYVMQARRFFGPSRQYAEPWAIPADGRGAPGSQAAAVRDERPQATGPRLNRPTPAGSDPADERSREAEEDERIERWRQQYPADAEAIAAQVQTEMAADARWKGTPKGIVEAAARSRYRNLILARLGPRAA
jgi:hypothetical protein